MSVPRYLCGLSIILLLLLQQSKPGAAFTEDAFQALDSVVLDATAYIPYDASSPGQWFDRFESMTRQGLTRIDDRADAMRQCLAAS